LTYSTLKEVMRMKGQHRNQMRGKGKAGGQGGGQCDCDDQNSGKRQRQRNRNRNQSSEEYCGNKETTPEAQPESSSVHKED